MDKHEREKNGSGLAVEAHRLVSRIFGIPIWTEDFDGEMRKRRARLQPNGKIIFRAIWGTTIGNADGSVKHTYVRRWQPRQTFFG